MQEFISTRCEAVSTAKNTNSILKEISRQNKTDIDLKIHFGDVTSDFKASSLVRMKNKPGRNGHLFNTNKIYTNKYFDKKPNAEHIPNKNQKVLLFVLRLFQKK